MLPNIYLLIDHHCKTQSELTEMLKNSPNLLNFLQGVLDPLRVWTMDCRGLVKKFAALCLKLHTWFFISNT